MTMEYQVYLDVLFFWNFLMDCLMLHQTELLLGKSKGNRKRRIVRIGIAGGIGALGSCLVTLCLGLPIFLKVVLTIPGLSCLMVLTAFPGTKGGGGRRLFFKRYLTLLADSLLLEGLIVFLQYRFSFRTIWAVLLSGGLTELGILIYKRMRTRRSHLYNACLCCGGEPISVKGFYDTGNHLACPWNGKAVHILDESCLEKPPSEGEFFYIPFSSVGKEGGIMRAVQAESLRLFWEEGELFIEKPIVALGAASLFDGRPYRMILHSSVAEEKGD